MDLKNTDKAIPFVQWVGGKRLLLPKIVDRLPPKIKNYWEPFLGGGAVFFSLENIKGQAHISDLNEELILTYSVVKENPDALIKALLVHKKNHEAEGYYYEVRASVETEAVARAARFIYLNRTGYKGLYRVNKSGGYNVAKGSHKNPVICNPENLKAVSKVLKNVSIKNGQFNKIVSPARGDFVYCDPPYDGCYTSYQADGFDEGDQRRLQSAVQFWDMNGINVMISNSNTPLIRELYKGYKISTIKYITNISQKGKVKREDVLITNY